MDWSFLDDHARIDELLFLFESDAVRDDVWMRHMTESFAGSCISLIGMGIVFYEFNPIVGVGIEPQPQPQYRSMTRAQAGAVVAHMLSRGFDYNDHTSHDMITRASILTRMFMQESDITAMVAARWPAVAARRIARIQAYIEFGLEDASSNRIPFVGIGATADMCAYRDWRVDQLENESPVCRVEFACRFVKDRGIAMSNMRRMSRLVSMSGDFYRDLQPWQSFTRYDCLGFRPAQFGAEARLVFDAKISWARIIERLAPELLCVAYVDEPVLFELQARERLARETVETVAMAQLHHECAIPLDLVNLIVGYVHPWHGIAPKMKLTPKQQADQAAFEARHS
jgi:hypothetical protein